MTNKELAKLTYDLLMSHNEWQNRYARYAKTIQRAKDNRMDKIPIMVKPPLCKYSSVSRVNASVFAYDLRLGGQSVAEVAILDNDSIERAVLTVTQQKAKNNSRYFDPQKKYTETISKPGELVTPWSTKEASNFRSDLKKVFAKGIYGSVKSPEHYIESLMLRELNKKQRKNKALANIQPVKLLGAFFQMPTPFKASKHNCAPTYSKQYGGGIDITARVRHSNGESRICVMELKDENKKNEPREMVIQQAIVYATFIATLLKDSKAGEEWWKIFKPNTNAKIESFKDIDVVTVMPKNKDTEDEELEVLTLDNGIKLHIYSLYYELSDDFKSIKQFSGTLPKQLMK